MKPIHVLIADDEEMSQQRAARLLAKDPAFVIDEFCSNGKEVLDVLSTKKIDLLFLDIEMPLLSGIDLVGSIPEDRRPFIVFITAYDEYAVQAFEYYAIDYLLKPFSNERFEKTLLRVKKRLSGEGLCAYWSGLAQYAADRKLPGDHIAVKTGRKYHFINPSDIAYITAGGNNCEIWLRNGEKHVHRDTITHLLSILPTDQFLRVHHSYIVSSSFIQQVKRIAFGEVELIMKDGRCIKVSRKYKDLIRKMIAKK